MAEKQVLSWPLATQNRKTAALQPRAPVPCGTNVSRHSQDMQSPGQLRNRPLIATRQHPHHATDNLLTLLFAEYEKLHA